LTKKILTFSVAQEFKTLGGARRVSWSTLNSLATAKPSCMMELINREDAAVEAETGAPIVLQASQLMQALRLKL
jgi:hypothetical protein